MIIHLWFFLKVAIALNVVLIVPNRIHESRATHHAVTHAREWSCISEVLSLGLPANLDTLVLQKHCDVPVCVHVPTSI
jgi:hypothetical protein